MSDFWKDYEPEPTRPTPVPTNCRHCGGPDNVLCGGQCKVAAQRQWVGLTDEEIYKIDCLLITDITELVIAIEAKLKEKNT